MCRILTCCPSMTPFRPTIRVVGRQLELMPLPLPEGRSLENMSRVNQPKVFDSAVRLFEGDKSSEGRGRESERERGGEEERERERERESEREREKKREKERE